jgi:hypothetical protein
MTIRELLRQKTVTTRQVVEALGLDPSGPARLRVLRQIRREGVDGVLVGREYAWPTSELQGWLEPLLRAESREARRKSKRRTAGRP